MLGLQCFAAMGSGWLRNVTPWAKILEACSCSHVAESIRSSALIPLESVQKESFGLAQAMAF